MMMKYCPTDLVLIACTGQVHAWYQNSQWPGVCLVWLQNSWWHKRLFKESISRSKECSLQALTVSSHFLEWLEQMLTVLLQPFLLIQQARPSNYNYIVSHHITYVDGIAAVFSAWKVGCIHLSSIWQAGFPCSRASREHGQYLWKTIPWRVSAHYILTIFVVAYYNAHSLFSKIDHLHALVTAKMPDTVCIGESWLDNSISDSEITLPGYIIVCLDQNCHGGGILMYFKTTPHAV